MARGHKCPSKKDHRHSNKHTPGVHRWVIQKANQHKTDLDDYINDIASVGSRRKMFDQHRKLAALKRRKAQEERHKLETTSLKDLIK